jgi:hypothetical protein
MTLVVIAVATFVGTGFCSCNRVRGGASDGGPFSGSSVRVSK